MESIVRITFSVLLGIFISFIALFLLGSLSLIKAYDHPLHIPQIKLIFLQMFIYMTMSVSVGYLFYEFFKFKPKRMLCVIAATALGVVLLWLTLIYTSDRSAVSLGYVSIGNYLRDLHEINWFFMDWNRYAFTAVLYLVPIYSALALILIERILIKEVTPSNLLI